MFLRGNMGRHAFSRHFGIFHGPKRATTGSKRAKHTCLSIPSGLGTTLEEMIFFAPVTLVDPPLAPSVRGPGWTQKGSNKKNICSICSRASQVAWDHSWKRRF